MPAKLAPVPSPAPSAPAALAAIVASISAWLDAALVQYRGAGARAFFRAALLANVSPRPINVSMLGPPGTAKTAMGEAFAASFGGTFAGRTLSPWTTDAELLGAVDIAALTAGRLERAHDAAHPDFVTAQTAMADEWSRSVGGIRAMFLSILNERRLPTGEPIEAHVIIAASNMRLTSEEDQAANDRMHLRIDVPRLMDPAELGAVIWGEARIREPDGTITAPVAASLPPIPPGALAALREYARDFVDVPREIADAVTAFAVALRGTAPENGSYPDVSERRWRRACCYLLTASAALRGSDLVDWIDVMDVLPMVYDEGAANRPAVEAALTATIPTWVRALRDLDAVCVNATERAFRVASGEPRKGEGDQHAKWRTEMRDTLKAFDAFGEDVKAKAVARANRAREEVDAATLRGAAALEAREA